MSEKVTLEVASNEVKKWLDYKKISEKRITSSNGRESIDTMESAIVDGSLTFNEENKQFTHNLKFPIETTDGKSVINTLTYAPRLQVRDIEKAMRGVKAGETQATIKAYISALTGQPAGIIGALDSEDYNIAYSIASFFM